MRVTLALLGGVLGAGLGVVAVASPAAAVNPLCDGVVADGAPDQVTLDSLPLEQLDVRAAQQLVEREAPPSRRPVRVAVLDSGVIGPAIPVAARTTGITGSAAVTYYHGTAVAGLIAGDPRDDGRPVGIAPDAEIVDVRVYDDIDTDSGDLLTPDRLAAGLRWVARNAGDLNIRIANVSLATDPSPALKRAVRAVRQADVVLVAASGNRPKEGEPFDEDFADDTAGPGEDAATVLYPTGYDDVVSASSTADGSGAADVTPLVVKNSHTSVAVPTHDAVSYGLDGRPCVIEPLATSWAAAEVSGMLALLWQMYPKDTDEQVVARLLNTANGTPDDRTPLTGAGVVQLHEALTRPLDPGRNGEVERTVAAARDTSPATAPVPDSDLLAETREDAVWWGLIGGGVLVVACCCGRCWPGGAARPECETAPH